MDKHSFDDMDKDILKAIKGFARKYGFGPSLRDIMDMVGIRSTSAMKYRLDWLEAEGYLRPRVKGITRAYVVVK
jgi:repressor LexA